MSEKPPLQTLFRPEDAEGLAAMNAMQTFAQKLGDDDVRAACEEIEKHATHLAELLGLDVSQASLALVTGCALQRREIEQCQV